MKNDEFFIILQYIEIRYASYFKFEELNPYLKYYLQFNT